MKEGGDPGKPYICQDVSESWRESFLLQVCVCCQVAFNKGRSLNRLLQLLCSLTIHSIFTVAVLPLLFNRHPSVSPRFIFTGMDVEETLSLILHQVASGSSSLISTFPRRFISIKYMSSALSCSLSRNVKDFTHFFLKCFLLLGPWHVSCGRRASLKNTRHYLRDFRKSGARLQSGQGKDLLQSVGFVRYCTQSGNTRHDIAHEDFLQLMLEIIAQQDVHKIGTRQSRSHSRLIWLLSSSRVFTVVFYFSASRADTSFGRFRNLNLYPRYSFRILNNTHCYFRD